MPRTTVTNPRICLSSIRGSSRSSISRSTSGTGPGSGRGAKGLPSPCRRHVACLAGISAMRPRGGGARDCDAAGGVRQPDGRERMASAERPTPRRHRAGSTGLQTAEGSSLGSGKGSDEGPIISTRSICAGRPMSASGCALGLTRTGDMQRATGSALSMIRSSSGEGATVRCGTWCSSIPRSPARTSVDTWRAVSSKEFLKATDRSWKPLWVSPALLQKSGWSLERCQWVRRGWHVRRGTWQGSKGPFGGLTTRRPSWWFRPEDKAWVLSVVDQNAERRAA